MRIINQLDNMEYIFINGFEYKRVASIAKASIFGLTIFKKVGDLSTLFGVDWNGTKNIEA